MPVKIGWFIALLIGLTGYSQTNPNDTLSTVDTLTTATENRLHYPKKAALWSTFIPGAGQIYNEIGYRRVADKKHRAWWKVPVIYGGLAACAYYYYYNNQFAYLTKKEILFRQNYPESYLDQRFINYSYNELINGNESLGKVGYETYNNRRVYFMAGFIGVWGLNVLEAYVDGHFVTFDVSEDLSLTWRPTFLTPQQPGLNLTLHIN